jgi:hypothetical protein
MLRIRACRKVCQLFKNVVSNKIIFPKYEFDYTFELFFFNGFAHPTPLFSRLTQLTKHTVYNYSE